VRHQKIRGKSNSIFNQRTERQGQFSPAFLFIAPVDENVQDFWILKQPKLLSVKEALSDLSEMEK
jgi:hypothetical protein